MPDITMCKDSECYYRRHCYRYVAVPDKHRQSYFSEGPRTDKAASCLYYIDAGDYGRVTPVDDVDDQYK